MMLRMKRRMLPSTLQRYEDDGMNQKATHNYLSVEYRTCFCSVLRVFEEALCIALWRDPEIKLEWKLFS
jgi:hypothetical protein